MKHIRRWVYRHGFRPSDGSMFYNPTLDMLYSCTDQLFGEKSQIIFKKSN